LTPRRLYRPTCIHTPESTTNGSKTADERVSDACQIAVPQAIWRRRTQTIGYPRNESGPRVPLRAFELA
jgi:hypothetical protein